jgi:uncharacterized protein YsxB (DUF464 family)
VITVHIHYSGHTTTQISIRGHAGGRSGTDVVCAAVSAVIQTALAGLLHYSPEDVEWSMKRGNLLVKIKTPRSDFAVILNTMYIGLKNIENEHPDRIRIHLHH